MFFLSNVQNLALGGYVRVDGTAYQWLGNGSPSLQFATSSDVQITPTRTIFTLQAGPMALNVTFLSPIEVSGSVF